MKKKLLIVLLALTCTAYLACSLTACAENYDGGGDTSGNEQNNEQTEHTHINATAVKENEVSATCTEDGYYDSVIYCTLCGKEISRETITIPATGHKYENSWSCSICGYSEVTVTEDLYFTLCDDGTSYAVAVIGTSTDAEIVIPYTYNGLPVTSISDYAFSYCDALESVTIPDSITYIGEYAFFNCTSLVNIKAGSSNTVYKTVDGNLYSRDGTTLIQYAIGKKDTSFVIPDGVTTISDYAFYNCTALESITIPDGLTYIGDGAFEDTAYYNNDDNWEDGVLYIGKYLIKANTSVSGSYTIKDDTTLIAAYSFYGCTSLESIIIPNSVNCIGDAAFWYCPALTCVDIGSGVISIGNRVFANCASLTTINVSPSNTSYKSSDNVLYSYNGTILLTYAAGKTETSFTIPDGVTTISDYAFYNCTALESITIPDGVTTISDDAFRWCTALESITIPDGVTYVGDYAFQRCTALKSVTLSNNMTSIGICTFYDCSSLKSIIIPDSVTSIGTYAFYNCNALEKIVIGSALSELDISAFYECTAINSIEVSTSNTAYKTIDGNLYNYDGTELIYCATGKTQTSLTIPYGVTTIDAYAFYYCTALESITLPESIASIGDYAFSYCISLKSINLPEGLTEIGTGVFYRCGLTSITIPANVTTIGDYALFCLDLESVTITGESKLNYIGIGAFRGVFTSITLPEGLTTIETNAFYFCTKLESVILPDSVTYIGTTAFRGCSSLKNIYFTGTAEQMSGIVIDPNNDVLLSATIYYYAENDGTITESGNYWYYDSEGNIVTWNI